jgi:hypothetical protein
LHAEEADAGKDAHWSARPRAGGRRDSLVSELGDDEVFNRAACFSLVSAVNKITDDRRAGD